MLSSDTQHDFDSDNYAGLIAGLLAGLQGTPLERWAIDFSRQIDENLSHKRYGDLARWEVAVRNLPAIELVSSVLDQDVVSAASKTSVSVSTGQQLREGLQSLLPWRKGPFDICGVQIDTEWRSDFKWNRLQQAIEPLQGRTVLDVGCGSGYHCWRMAGEGAALALGIEPSPLFVMQYWAIQRYLRDPRVWVVPQRMEQLPESLHAFDTVFSMGILYHRRAPFDHLLALRECLRPGGQLVLETLVIDDSEGNCLVPVGRYAKMGNVWFIPSVSSLQDWLVKMRFQNVALIDVSVTGVEEQRSTEWMQFESLSDFLDPDDSSKTIEGYPAPRRAILTASAP